VGIILQSDDLRFCLPSASKYEGMLVEDCIGRPYMFVKLLSALTSCPLLLGIFPVSRSGISLLWKRKSAAYKMKNNLCVINRKFKQKLPIAFLEKSVWFFFQLTSVLEGLFSKSDDIK